MTLNNLLLDIANNIRLKYNEINVPLTEMSPQEFSVKLFLIAYPTLALNMFDASGTGSSMIKKITLSEDITSIGKGAFAFLKELQSFILHDKIVSIGAGAFKGCSNLVNINLEECVNLTSIGASAFEECSSLGKITIPSGITSIESLTFSKAKFESLSFTGVTTIKEDAFYSCKAAGITIPAQVTTIQKNAFRTCSSEFTIEVDANNEVYDSRDDCNAIIEKGTNTLIQGFGKSIIPNSVVALGDYAFKDVNLSEIYIPESVETLGEYALSSSYLKKVEFAQNSRVTTLSKGLFGASYTLVSIIFPPNIVAIPSNAFQFNTALTLLDFRNYFPDKPPTLEAAIFSKDRVIIVVPNGKKENWIGETNWSTYKDNIKTLDEYNASLQV